MLSSREWLFLDVRWTLYPSPLIYVYTALMMGLLAKNWFSKAGKQHKYPVSKNVTCIDLCQTFGKLLSIQILYKSAIKRRNKWKDRYRFNPIWDKNYKKKLNQTNYTVTQIFKHDRTKTLKVDMTYFHPDNSIDFCASATLQTLSGSCNMQM